MDANDSLSLCNAADYLANSFNMNALLLIRIALYLTSIIFCITLIKVQGKHLAVHNNALILFSSHHVSLILQGTEMVIHGFTFFQYRTFTNPCDLLWTYRSCAFFQIISYVASFATILSLFMLAIERCYASYRYQQYEKENSALGVWLTIIQWTIAAALAASYLYDVEMDYQMAYCTLAIDQTQQRVSLILTTLVVLELLAIGGFYALLVINRRRKNRLITASLTKKYQVDENIRALKLLLPTILTHAVIFIPPLCFFSIYFEVATDLNPLNFPLIVESLSWTPIYCAALPLVLFWRNRALRNSLKKTLNLGQVHAAQGSEQARAEQNTHFATLNNMWTRSLERNLAVTRVT